jgi:hypothetical protein
MLLGTPFIGALNCVIAPRMGRLFWRCPGGERTVAWMPVDTYREAPTALPAVAQEGTLDPEDGGETLVHMLVASQASEEPPAPFWELAADHLSAVAEVVGMVRPLVEQYNSMLQDLSEQDAQTTAAQAHAAAHQAAGRMLLASASQVKAALSKQLACKAQEEARWLAKLIGDTKLQDPDEPALISSTDQCMARSLMDHGARQYASHIMVEIIWNQNGWMQAVDNAITAADFRPDWAVMLRQRLARGSKHLWDGVRPQSAQEHIKQGLTQAVRGKLAKKGLPTDLYPAQRPSDAWHGHAHASAQAWMATTATATDSAVTQLLGWLAQQEQQHNQQVTQRRLSQKVAGMLVEMLQQPADRGQRLWCSNTSPSSLIDTWAVQAAYLLASQISLMAVAVHHPRQCCGGCQTRRGSPTCSLTWWARLSGPTPSPTCPTPCSGCGGRTAATARAQKATATSCWTWHVSAQVGPASTRALPTECSGVAATHRPARTVAMSKSHVTASSCCPTCCGATRSSSRRVAVML